MSPLTQVNKLIDEEEENSTGGSLTGPLDTVLNECNKCAELLFSSILNKKDKADRIRNALNVIDRFRSVRKWNVYHRLMHLN